MDNSITLETLEFQLEFLKKMYQIVRIVDPFKKKVLDCNDNHIKYTDGICYSYWNNDSICENCISMRAYSYNEIVYKLECTSDKVFMVTAMPIKIKESKVVLELLKEVTDTMFIGTDKFNKLHDIKGYISDMNDMVVKDALTSLYNRRFIDERLPVDIIQSIINNRPISIIMTDIDQFKIINDALGHVEGDLKIKEYGNILLKTIRGDNDWVARYGGDEFLICLNNTDNDTAYNIAERIRKEIEILISKTDNKDLNITGSFGICTMHKDKMTAEEMIRIADDNLFEAKKSGRNKVFR